MLVAVTSLVATFALAAPPGPPPAPNSSAASAHGALAQGPPPADYDKDGIPNTEDDCPTDPGNAANRGCPGAPAATSAGAAPSAPNALAKLSGGTITLTRPLLFKSGSSRLARGNGDLLDAVVQVIGAIPTHRFVIVRGHTDNRGRRISNVKLSRSRARTVVRALVKRGIDKARLRPDGVGPDVPIASNKSAEGRAKNRRVEFVIIDAGGP